MIDDLALFAARMDALFLYDASGRMRRVKSLWKERPAPRFFFGQTRDGNIWRFRYDLPTGLVRTLEELASAEPAAHDLRALPGCVDAIRTALTADLAMQHEWAGPAYRFPETVARPDGVVAVTEANADIVRDGFPWLPDELEASQPALVVVNDGMAVSVCRSVRVGRQAVEAGIETLTLFRGRGYATAVVAGWAQAVRDRGLIPLYSTSWTNLASQGVARRLGLVQYGVDYHWA
jgi:RimJ/RimL family protein N-acetyltransferase